LFQVGDSKPNTDHGVNGAPAVASLPSAVRGLRRARASFGALFADGHGAYLIAMIAFGAAAMSFHHVERRERQYREALLGLLNFRQEPFRGETRPVLASALLPDGVPWDFCGDLELLDATDRIAAQFSASLAAPAAVSDSLEPCTRDGCPKPTAGVGPAMTDRTAGSTLFVPSTTARIVDADLQSNARLLASRSLENHRSWVGHSFQAGRLTTMYFIELSGSIRIVPVLDLSDLPAHLTFAGAGYVAKALSGAPSLCPGHGRRRIQTRPYLDVIKFGLVRTLCQSITIAGPASGAHDSVVGTLCFDFAPPETVVYAMLEESAKLFELELVRFYKNGGIERCSAITTCKSSLDNLPSDELDQLERWWAQPAGTANAPAGFSGIRTFGGDQFFGARIDHHDQAPDHNEFDTVVFGRQQRRPISDWRWYAAMLLCAAIGAAATLRGVRRKARRADFALIRGLQVGTFELDAQDVVLGANDRAQEILDAKLPRFGGARRPVLFASQIDVDHVVVFEDERLPEGGVEFCRYAQIAQLRGLGHSRSYYAFTRKSGWLIRISESTFVDSRRDTHTFGTIDTYIDRADRERIIAAKQTLPPPLTRSAGRGRPR
jgi:hypothetical protein